MFKEEDRKVDIGGLAMSERGERCGDRVNGWCCTREEHHAGIHRGGFHTSTDEMSHWGAEWDDDRSTDLTFSEREILYG